MTLHYHGTPITPRSVLHTLAGKCFCVRYGAHGDLDWCVEHGQSVMLDNGAFSFWRRGDATDWNGYMDWCEPLLDAHTTWAVIPDVIDGDAHDNDRLIRGWEDRGLPRGAPVWHMHEAIDRLLKLCGIWERVCIGSSGQYATVGDDAWRRRMDEAMNELCAFGPAPTWLHMLRGMSLSADEYPFASVDSTDVARNHNRPGQTARGMADRWDSLQPAARWVRREQLQLGEAA